MKERVNFKDVLYLDFLDRIWPIGPDIAKIRTGSNQHIRTRIDGIFWRQQWPWPTCSVKIYVETWSVEMADYVKLFPIFHSWTKKNIFNFFDSEGRVKETFTWPNLICGLNLKRKKSGKMHEDHTYSNLHDCKIQVLQGNISHFRLI